ncbi:MAG TPA: hypothetical protein VIJ12_02180 [Candidatus Baltobacteraceae bacterium]
MPAPTSDASSDLDEPRWHASAAVVVALALYVTLPTKLTFGPTWIFPALVLVLLIPLTIFSPRRHQETGLQRGLSVALIAIVNALNIISVVRLILGILLTSHPAGYHAPNGRELLVAGGEIWVTNILVYALWFWELDAGGPDPRSHASSAVGFSVADFLFPQMLVGHRLACIKSDWKPRFFDYVYLAFTNAVTLGPADTMPLTRIAKLLMLAESATSFVTVAVILSRAVGMT